MTSGEFPPDERPTQPTSIAAQAAIVVADMKAMTPDRRLRLMRYSAALAALSQGEQEKTMKRIIGLAAVELLITIGLGLVICEQAALGAWKCLRRRPSERERHPD